MADEVLDAPAAAGGTQIAEYSATVAGLAKLRGRYANVAWDCSTTKGDKDARAVRLELVTLRTTLEASRQTLKAPVLDRGRLLDSEAKRITGEILALEKPVDEAIKAEEKRREQERQRKAAENAARIATLQARIEAIGEMAIRAVGKSAEEIARRIVVATGLPITEEHFQELLPRAVIAHSDTLAKLRDMHAAQLEHEAEVERQRLQAEALEQERQQRLAAEQAERDRVALEDAAIADIRRYAKGIHLMPACDLVDVGANLAEFMAMNYLPGIAAPARIQEALDETRLAIRTAHAAALDRDRMAAEQRAENDRLAAQRTELDRRAAVLRQQEEDAAELARRRKQAERDAQIAAEQRTSRLHAQAQPMLDILRTIDKLLDQGVSPALILDENSPTRDAMRDVFRAVA